MALPFAFSDTVPLASMLATFAFVEVNFTVFPDIAFILAGVASVDFTPNEFTADVNAVCVVPTFPVMEATELIVLIFDGTEIV